MIATQENKPNRSKFGIFKKRKKQSHFNSAQAAQTSVSAEILVLFQLGLVSQQGGRTWQAFGGGKNGHETFRQARIYNFRDICVVFARNLKFSNLTQ